MCSVNEIHQLAEQLIARYKLHTASSAFTVAFSGIDASGKGYISNLLQEELERKGYKVANINIDPWENPVPVRLKKGNPEVNFYNNVFRWNEFFEQLILPLQKNRSIYIETKLVRTHADEYYKYIYDYKNIDFLLIDGILLFQQRFLPHYHYTIWIDCSFETGLQRAVKRNIEKQDEEQLIHDYHTFYYAAQRLHFRRNNPKATAGIIFENN